MCVFVCRLHSAAEHEGVWGTGSTAPHILILGTDFVLATRSGCFTQRYTAGKDQTKVCVRQILSGHWRWQNELTCQGSKPSQLWRHPIGLHQRYVSAHAPNHVRLLLYAARCVVSSRTLRVAQVVHWPIYRLSEHGIGIRLLAKALRPVCLLWMHGLDTFGDTHVMTRGCSFTYTCILFLG